MIVKLLASGKVRACSSDPHEYAGFWAFLSLLAHRLFIRVSVCLLPFISVLVVLLCRALLKSSPAPDCLGVLPARVSSHSSVVVRRKHQLQGSLF